MRALHTLWLPWFAALQVSVLTYVQCSSMDPALQLPCAQRASWVEQGEITCVFHARSCPRYASPTCKCRVSYSVVHSEGFNPDWFRDYIKLNMRILQHSVILTNSANNSKALRLLNSYAAIPGFYISHSSKSPLISSIKLQARFYGGLIPFVLSTVKHAFKAIHITWLITTNWHKCFYFNFRIYLYGH